MKTESNLRWPTYRYDEWMDGGKMDRTLSVELFFEENESGIDPGSVWRLQEQVYGTNCFGRMLRVGSVERPILIVEAKMNIRGTEPIPDLQEHVWKMHEQLNTIQWRHRALTEPANALNTERE